MGIGTRLVYTSFVSDLHFLVHVHLSVLVLSEAGAIEELLNAST
jgi:hypothetical protein